MSDLAALIICLVLSAPALSKAYDLEEVTRVADSICGKVVTSGHSESESITYDRDSIPHDLLENIKKELGDHFKDIVRTEKSLTVSNSSFSGIKQEDLAAHNSNVRKCRKEIGLAVIKSQIDNK